MTISPFTDVMAVNGGSEVPGSSKKQSGQDELGFQAMMDGVAKAPGNVQDLSSKTDTFKAVSSATEPSKLTDKATKTETVTAADNKVSKETENDDSKLNTDTNDSLSNHKDVMEDNNEQVVSELKDKILNEAAKKLGISTEELEEILASLGITAADLLNTDNVSLLVSEVAGEGDIMSLITDENALNMVNGLNELVADITAEVAEELGVTPDELKEMVSEIVKDTEPEAFDIKPELTEDKTVIEKPAETVKTDLPVKQTDVKPERTETANNGVQVNETVTRDTETGNTGNENRDASTDYKEERHGNVSENAQQVNQFAPANVSNEVPVTEPDNVLSHTVTDAEEILSQVKDQIKANFTGELTELQMQLNPENLGTVNLSVASRGGNVTAQLHVQNDSVLQALEAQIAQIKESLEAQGVKVNAIEVMVSSHGFEQNLEQGNDSNDQQEEVNENLRKATRKLNLNGGLTDEIIEELDEAEALSAEMMAADGNSMDYKV